MALRASQGHVGRHPSLAVLSLTLRSRCFGVGRHQAGFHAVRTGTVGIKVVPALRDLGTRG